MTKRLQSGRVAASQPLWLRRLALLCVMLVGVMGTAQAAHVHGDWLPKTAHHAGLPADGSQGQGEDHCPLCVAMHSALPATMQVAPEPVLCVVAVASVHAERGVSRQWSFAMFSRPPPAALVVATTAG